MSANLSGWQYGAHKMDRARPLGYAHRSFFLNEGTPTENTAFGRRRIFSAILPSYFLGLCLVLSAIFPRQDLT